MIGLVDGNNFFVSCERIFNLRLRERPVSVLSNNDGCVVSRSNEFKALNIPMGTPYFQLRDLIKPHGLVLISSNYELYGDISHRMIETLHVFSDAIEQYSIDEAFIDLKRPGSDYYSCAQEIRNTILQWVGVPCGVGFAQTKTLAKIANHIGKKSPDGIFVMPDDPSEILAETPVEDVWGVGRKLAPKLQQIGICTAQQLASSNLESMRHRFSITLVRTMLELRGQPVVENEKEEALSQSISWSRCFGQPVEEYSDLAESVAHYTSSAAEKLRKEGQCAAGIRIYFQYYPEYRPHLLDGGFDTVHVIFEHPTASTSEMLSQITPKLPSIFRKGRRYKKSGILFFGLEREDPAQLSLFQPSAEIVRSKKLSAVRDQLNRQYGRGSIFNLSEGIDKKWQMRREHLSPGYTTDWNQLLRVK